MSDKSKTISLSGPVLYTYDDVRNAYFKGVQDMCQVRRIDKLSTTRIYEMWTKVEQEFRSNAKMVASVILTISKSTSVPDRD